MKTYPDISTQTLQLIDAEMAHGYRIIPVNKDQDVVVFESDQNDVSSIQKELQILLGYSIEINSVPSNKIDYYLQRNYRKHRSREGKQLQYSDDFLLQIISEAKELGSSDIHFECFEQSRRVRFRIDGRLIERYVIPLEDYPKIVNRIKIMAGLDISEKRLPQDGRIQFKQTDDEFDIRVSTMPTLHGEKIVLRLLSKSTSSIELSALGFQKKELEIYLQSVQKPNGIVLISGPTGSGKTTTLYATLKMLNKADTNILTIEDPIEYTLEGINQVQLKEDIGLTFPKALRTFLRQDPDIIMVGEIRDIDTANMAIRAALTGHLVFSTIHTNSAWATISRLIDMDIPSFLIASTLNMSVAQRLVRKLCNHCKEEEDYSDGLIDSLDKHYTAVGCPECYHTGYKGRKAIYELIPITEELVQKIASKDWNVNEYLKEKQISTLKDNAIELVKQGITSVEEIYPLLIGS